MKAACLIVSVVGTALASCAGIIKETPITELHIHDGPLAASHPGLVIKTKSGGGKLNDGTVAYALPDGETCKGNWRLVSGRMTERKGNGSDGGEMQVMAKNGGMSAGGGKGAYVSHGNNGALGEGAGQCSNGATFEFAFKSNGNQARGALKDSTGNIFRLVLR